MERDDSSPVVRVLRDVRNEIDAANLPSFSNLALRVEPELAGGLGLETIERARLEVFLRHALQVNRVVSLAGAGRLASDPASDARCGRVWEAVRALRGPVDRGGHRAGASDLAIVRRPDRPPRCTAAFAFLVLTGCPNRVLPPLRGSVRSSLGERAEQFAASLARTQLRCRQSGSSAPQPCQLPTARRADLRPLVCPVRLGLYPYSMANHSANRSRSRYPVLRVSIKCPNS